jgi:hypothetical protein
MGTIRPRTRTAGANPGVRWTSEARTSTIFVSTEAKSRPIES